MTAFVFSESTANSRCKKFHQKYFHMVCQQVQISNLQMHSVQVYTNVNDTSNNQINLDIVTNFKILFYITVFTLTVNVSHF